MLDLARRHADKYVAATRPRAILVTGSVAAGEADRYSDLDMMAYYDDLPSEEPVRAVRKQLDADRFASVGQANSASVSPPWQRG